MPDTITQPKLPDDWAELIRLALHDLELCEQDGRYTIDMGHYHIPIDHECYVCFAGGIMAQTLNGYHHADLGPADFDDDTSYKLCVLSNIGLGMPFHYVASKYGFVSYELRPEGWKKYIRKVIKAIEAGEIKYA